jgi:hypothetical protein
MRAASRRWSRSEPVGVALSCWLAFAALLFVPLTARAQAPAATACASPRPVATMVPGDGTGAATPAASPVPVGLATPAVANCLTVTLTIDRLEAGPRVLTLTIKNEHGKPVTGATVTLLTHSLEMNHGISSYNAKMTKRGVYVASDVSLGMGGKWQTDVLIGLPGHGRAIATFVFSLNGPKM